MSPVAPADRATPGPEIVLSPDEVVATVRLASALAWSGRRVGLCAHCPPCPGCGESRQIQLRQWCVVPAQWRCRVCGHGWACEPAALLLAEQLVGEDGVARDWP